MEYKINSYAVVDCDGEIIYLGSGLECSSMVKKMNSRPSSYTGTPYKAVLVCGSVKN